MLSKKIAIDLGTSTIRIFVKGEGIVITEPSVVAVKRGSARFVAFGNEVLELMRRAPDSVVVRFPLRDGAITDLAATEAMLHHFIDRVQGRQRIFKPEVMICVPTGLTSIDRRAVTEAAVSAGARQVWLIDEPLAAAMGAGLPVADKRGSAICEIGGGTTEVAVIAESGTVATRSVKVGGNRMDSAIAELLRRKYSLDIDVQTAEAAKISVGSALPIKQALVADVTGRDVASGSPKTFEVQTNDVVEAISESLRLIARLSKRRHARWPLTFASGGSFYPAAAHGCEGWTSISRRKRASPRGLPTSLRLQSFAGPALRSTTSKF